MHQVIHYINETLGVKINVMPIHKEGLGKLPMFINEAYRLYTADLFHNELLLVEPRNTDHFSVLQMEKHCDLLKGTFNKKVVLLMEDLPAYNRKRLIESGINFIVPGKQLFLPELLISLKESYSNPRAKQKSEKLLPSAQFLLIYYIIHRHENWQIENYSFKEIANKVGYTQMAITKAVENLKRNDLIDVRGEKEKYIKFKFDRAELWRHVEHYNLLVNPVLKRVFVDELPKDIYMLYANASAMPEYSDLNPSKQEYRAIEKTIFYALQKSNALVNANDYEGKYCIEVWKYDPLKLVDELPNDMSVVDPLSLYLSLKDSNDERIEMALEQIIEKFIW